jgi:hypothetical protein
VYSPRFRLPSGFYIIASINCTVPAKTWDSLFQTSVLCPVDFFSLDVNESIIGCPNGYT